MIPRKVAATLVKLAMPPPVIRTLPSGCFSAVMRERIVFAYSYVCCSEGAPVIFLTKHYFLLLKKVGKYLFIVKIIVMLEKHNLFPNKTKTAEEEYSFYSKNLVLVLTLLFGKYRGEGIERMSRIHSIFFPLAHS